MACLGKYRKLYPFSLKRLTAGNVPGNAGSRKNQSGFSVLRGRDLAA